MCIEGERRKRDLERFSLVSSMISCLDFLDGLDRGADMEAESPYSIKAV